jgi:ATP-dependent metalloprotease
MYDHKAQLIVNMAGRAAEELLYGSKNVTSGSSSDLKSATLLAKKMVMQYGFGLSDGKISIYLDVRFFLKQCRKRNANLYIGILAAL